MYEGTRWRNIAAGGDLCFITTGIEEFVPILAVPENAEMALAALDFYRNKYGVLIHGYVIMPEHLHLLLGLPASLLAQKLMADYKRYTARQMLQWCRDNGRSDLLEIFARCGAVDGEDYSVWQRSFRSVPLCGRKAAIVKLEYIHGNPVRRGLVATAQDWVCSSASAYEGGNGPIAVDYLEW